jgi:hypothetical protein
MLQLAGELARHSSPASLAVLAKACFSRELLDPLLAAALAEAVAGAAPALGPQEVHGVLRLLVEHLGGGGSGAAGASEDGGGRGGAATALQHAPPSAAAAAAAAAAAPTPAPPQALSKAFRVLAEGMLRCSAALTPVQLAEAVALLGRHGYDDAFGLFLLAKEAAARLPEFQPPREASWVVVLLRGIAGMRVADEGMAGDAAAAVAARRGEYSGEQLAAINAALSRMGCVDSQLV